MKVPSLKAQEHEFYKTEVRLGFQQSEEQDPFGVFSFTDLHHNI